MTRYAIFSDVHANLEALTAVLDKAAGLKIDRYICCGDIVGYGVDPNECIDRLRASLAYSVMGNHEYAILFPRSGQYVGAKNEAQQSFDWTIKHLNHRNIEYLRNLPYFRRVDNIVFSHGSPVYPENFDYVRDNKLDWDISDVNSHFQFNREHKVKLAFYGHSHVAAVNLQYQFKNGETDHLQLGDEAVIDILASRPSRKAMFLTGLVNVGSVGQPRDGNSKPVLVVYDDYKERIEFHRLEYDTRVTAQKILGEGLDPWLAERLSLGR